MLSDRVALQELVGSGCRIKSKLIVHKSAGTGYTCCEVEQNGCIALKSKNSVYHFWREAALQNRKVYASQTWPFSLALPVTAVLPCSMMICYLPKQMPALASQRHSLVPHFISSLPADVFVFPSVLYHSCLLEKTQQRDSRDDTALTVKGKLLADERPDMT